MWFQSSNSFLIDFLFLWVKTKYSGINSFWQSSIHHVYVDERFLWNHEFWGPLEQKKPFKALPPHNMFVTSFHKIRSSNLKWIDGYYCVWSAILHRIAFSFKIISSSFTNIQFQTISLALCRHKKFILVFFLHWSGHVFRFHHFSLWNTCYQKKYQCLLLSSNSKIFWTFRRLLYITKQDVSILNNWNSPQESDFLARLLC